MLSMRRPTDHAIAQGAFSSSPRARLPRLASVRLGAVGSPPRAPRAVLWGVPLVAMLAGCSEIDLGEVPFFCNSGSPRCPEGYVCQRASGRSMCIRDGLRAALSTDAAASVRDKGVVVLPDSGPQRDRGAARDRGVDRGQPAADGGSVPDKGTVPDTTPRLGCQSNAECTEADSPCCCPIPLLPNVWGCLPACLDPFCVGS